MTGARSAARSFFEQPVCTSASWCLEGPFGSCTGLRILGSWRAPPALSLLAPSVCTLCLGLRILVCLQEEIKRTICLSEATHYRYSSSSALVSLQACWSCALCENGVTPGPVPHHLLPYVEGIRALVRTSQDIRMDSSEIGMKPLMFIMRCAMPLAGNILRHAHMRPPSVTYRHIFTQQVKCSAGFTRADH